MSMTDNQHWNVLMATYFDDEATRFAVAHSVSVAGDLLSALVFSSNRSANALALLEHNRASRLGLGISPGAPAWEAPSSARRRQRRLSVAGWHIWASEHHEAARAVREGPARA